MNPIENLERLAESLEIIGANSRQRYIARRLLKEFNREYRQLDLTNAQEVHRFNQRYSEKYKREVLGK